MNKQDYINTLNDGAKELNEKAQSIVKELYECQDTPKIVDLAVDLHTTAMRLGTINHCLELQNQKKKQEKKDD